jgi:hypothetical protein
MDPEQPLAALRAVEAIGGRGGPATRVTYIYSGSAASHSRGAGGLEAWGSEQNPQSAVLEGDAWRAEVEAAVLASEYK